MIRIISGAPDHRRLPAEHAGQGHNDCNDNNNDSTVLIMIIRIVMMIIAVIAIMIIVIVMIVIVTTISIVISIVIVIAFIQNMCIYTHFMCVSCYLYHNMLMLDILIDDLLGCVF